MKKFINACIYRYEDATEILMEDAVIKQIGSNLPKADTTGTLFESIERWHSVNNRKCLFTRSSG